MKKKLLIYFCFLITMVLMSSFLFNINVQGNEETLSNIFMTVDKEGTVKEIDMSALETSTINEQKQKKKTRSINKEIDIGVVNFKTKASGSINTNYNNADTNPSGYLNSSNNRTIELIVFIILFAVIILSALILECLYGSNDT